jgi:hypothetical protein
VNKIFHARTGKYKTCCKFCFWLQVLFPVRIGLRQGVTMHISQICIFRPGLTMRIFEICIIGNDSTMHITKVYRSPRKMLREKISHKICSQWANLLWAKICSINLLMENQICSRRINFAHGESWIALYSTFNLSMDAWHNFYPHKNCSKRRKFAHSKEELLTKIKFAQSKNLLKKFAHSRNLLTEFARSIEQLLTRKNLAG